MKYLMLLLLLSLLLSCWKNTWDYKNQPAFSTPKVWGLKPVYAALADAQVVLYDPHKHPVTAAGNIYTFGKFIFQVDEGRGIHVINNTVSSEADRIGFITVNGCAQISIRGSYLYTNSYADLVVIDISDPVNMKVVNRVTSAFPEFQYNYPLVEPSVSGYYECPRYDSVVVRWVEDSIYTSCYKN